MPAQHPARDTAPRSPSHSTTEATSDPRPAGEYRYAPVEPPRAFDEPEHRRDLLARMLETMRPPDAPAVACPACGDPALDGHITCGRLECREADRRHAAAALYAAAIATRQRFDAPQLRADGSTYAEATAARVDRSA